MYLISINHISASEKMYYSFIKRSLTNMPNAIHAKNLFSNFQRQKRVYNYNDSFENIPKVITTLPFNSK